MPAAPPAITSRSQWGANPLVTPASRISVPTKELWLHHTAGEQFGAAGMRMLQAFTLHRQDAHYLDLEYCLAPATRVLTGDLRWAPLGDLKVGDSIMAFSEHAGSPTAGGRAARRRWEMATVERTSRVRLPCYRVLLADGTEFIASEEHRWLCKRGVSGNHYWYTTKQLVNRPSLRAVKLIEPWREDRGRDAGYLAGMFDADGSYVLAGDRQRDVYKRGSFIGMLALAQNQNVALDAVVKMLAERGTPFAVYDRENAPILHVSITGGTRAHWKFLGEVRPPRLLKRFADQASVGPLGSFWGSEHVEVVESEFIGVQEVVALRTSTGTLVAEGYAHHNSFVVDHQSCEIFESRGPARDTAATGGGHNLISHAICVMGNFEIDPVSDHLVRTLANLVAWGYEQGWWPLGFTGGHRDASGNSTACPGDHLEAKLLAINQLAATIHAGGAQPTPAPVSEDQMASFPSASKPANKFRGADINLATKAIRLRGGATMVPADPPNNPNPWQGVYRRTDGKAGFVIWTANDLDEYAYELP